MSKKGKLPAGIDLGTTMSSLAILGEDGNPKIIANREGEYTTPSAVLWLKNEIVVGTQALQSAALYPDFLATRFKPRMGSGKAIFAGEDGKSRTAVELSDCVLKKLREDCSERLGEEIKDAVITVPAYFNEAGRRATVEAGKRAGLNVIGVLNEPTAAAIAYAMDKQKDQAMLTYDLGGGTFDVTVLSVQSGRIQTLATDGNADLGGSDFDDEIAKHVLERFKKQHSKRPDPRKKPAFYLDLRTRSELAKKSLSTTRKTVVSVGVDGKQVVVELTRDGFEKMIAKYIDETMKKSEATVKAAGMEWPDLNNIILVGGSTRIPRIVERLEKMSGKKPKSDVEPDLAVAKGAAIDAAMRIAEKGGRIIVAGKELPAPPVKKTDVIAHPLGCLAVDSISGIEGNKVIIPANTPLPADRYDRFALNQDNQTTARIVVVQGKENAVPQDCHVVGEVTLDGLPVKLPRETRIAVRYRYDADGIVHVNAKDDVSGKEANIDLDYKDGLNNANAN